MGFARTQEELERYYALGVRHFAGAQMTGAMYQTSPEIVQRLLPPPLEPADMPGALIFIAQYPDTNLGAGYREAALFLQCSYDGEAGTYCLSMPIDNEPRMHNGRDIFGFPKKLASIHVQRDGQLASGHVERAGVRIVELSVSIAAEMPQAPQTGPTFLFKAMPRVDLKPGFDGPVLLVRQQTEVEVVRFEVGVPEIVLRPSDADPWAEVEVVQPTIGFQMTSNNTMQPGKVVAEVDPDAFLPHYFKMTDFYAGD